MTQIPPQELFTFPCDHLFKVFGPNDEEFAVAVQAAASTVTPVALDAMKFRTSSHGAHQCVSMLVRVYDYGQLLCLYAALKRVPRLKYLL